LRRILKPPQGSIVEKTVLNCTEGMAAFVLHILSMPSIHVITIVHYYWKKKNISNAVRKLALINSQVFSYLAICGLLTKPRQLS
jgi:branched-subunit amino acid permease